LTGARDAAARADAEAAAAAESVAARDTEIQRLSGALLGKPTTPAHAAGAGMATSQLSLAGLVAGDGTGGDALRE
jgi:hypothetical protein